MPEITEEPIRRSTADLYGEQIIAMGPNSSMTIDITDRERVLQWIKARWNGTKVFATKVVGKECILFRLK